MSESPRHRLRDDVRVKVAYDDATPFGSVLGGGIERTVRRACQPIVEHRERHGMADVVACSQPLLVNVFAGELGGLFESGKLRPDCLYPASELVTPVALNITREGSRPTRVALDCEAFAELACWMGEFYHGRAQPDSGAGRRVFDALSSAGALTLEPRTSEELSQSDWLFVGHASVSTGRAPRLSIDPFFLPRSTRYPSSYQPLRAADLAGAEAILITHSHPDHFDLPSLLCLGQEARICVPEVARESLLSLDMAARLEQLGFERVERVAPGQRLTLGELSVDTLPFWGEQPTTGDVLHPEVRNQGCTYAVEARGQRALFLADSGRDRAGDVRELAADIRRRLGSVSVVFGGYRAFAVYPIHYLFSSVARYLLFVPESEWGVRQKTMNDGADLLETAERCGARWVVPYADGGAPWHWERGLGPRLDGARTENPAVDPEPEEVARSAAQRSSSREGPIASPVRVLVLRPGESCSFEDERVRVEHGPQQKWPYRRASWLQVNAALVRQDGAALPSARAVFAALAPRLATWREEGRISLFFFMRKSPDLRLRFYGDGSASGELSQLFDGLVESGVVLRWFSTVYEPESERFGGEPAMKAAHAWFDVDSTAWFELDRLTVAEQRTLSAEQLCLAVADDLVRRLLKDRAEMFALWESYARSLGGAAPREAQAFARPEPAALESLTSEGERAVLERYWAANEHLAEALAELVRTGQLQAGLRGVLSAVIQFHFHRHGLDSSAHLRLSRGMAESLNRELGS